MAATVRNDRTPPRDTAGAGNVSGRVVQLGSGRLALRDGQGQVGRLATMNDRPDLKVVGGRQDANGEQAYRRIKRERDALKVTVRELSIFADRQAAIVATLVLGLAPESKNALMLSPGMSGDIRTKTEREFGEYLRQLKDALGIP